MHGLVGSCPAPRCVQLQEVVEYDARGQRKAAATPLTPALEGGAAGEEEFGDFGWEQFDELVTEDEVDEEQDSVAPGGLRQASASQEEVSWPRTAPSSANSCFAMTARGEAVGKQG